VGVISRAVSPADASLASRRRPEWRVAGTTNLNPVRLRLTIADQHAVDVEIEMHAASMAHATLRNRCGF
jgi:hypothetical protein